MRRRDWLGGVGCFLSLVLLRSAFAEFSVGLGDIENPSSDASARFNEGLSAFHLMLAALDKKNAEEAGKQQVIAEQKIQEAAGLYRGAIGKADSHILKATPTSVEEQAQVGYFWSHAREFGIKPPVSQQFLVEVSSNLVNDFARRIRSQDVKTLVGDLRRRQAITDYAAELQSFLVSVTTMLILG